MSFPQVALGAGSLKMLRIPKAQASSSGSDSITLKNKEDLTELIQPHIKKTVTIDTVREQEIKWESVSTFSDTEVSGSSGDEFVFNLTKDRGEREVDNYAKYSESISPATLARHAQEIHAALPQNKFAHHTTTLCVALKNSGNSIKKFAFCNNDLMPPALRDKAEYKNYHVVRAEQAHAEGEFLQFLWKRQKQSLPEYTHIVAMGCSRPHCAECDVLLQLVLGQGYTAISAAIDASNTPVKEAAAVEADKKYANYYIPQGLQSLIETLTGVKLVCKGRYLSQQRIKQEAKSSTEPSQDVRRNPVRKCRRKNSSAAD